MSEQLPFQIDVGRVMGVNPSTGEPLSVRGSGGRVYTRIISCIAGVGVGTEVVIVKVLRHDKWIIVDQVQNSFSGKSNTNQAILAPPANLAAFSLPGSVIVEWETHPGDSTVSYHIQSAPDDSQSPDTSDISERLITRGSYYIYETAADDGFVWFRVRALRWLDDNNLVYSGWSGWVYGVAEQEAHDLLGPRHNHTVSDAEPTPGLMMVGNDSNDWQSRDLSQDVTIDGVGAVTVEGLQGRPMAATEPADTRVVMWSGANSQWQPDQVEADQVMYTAGESVGEILDETINSGVLHDITITDDDDLDISWSACEIWDAENDTEVDTDSGSDTCADNAVNYLIWTAGATLVLGVVKADPANNEIGIAEIACQEGDIWHIQKDDRIHRRTYEISEALEEMFPAIVTHGLIISEDTDVTNTWDVSLSAGTYYLNGHERHTVAAPVLSRVVAMVRWYKVAGVWTSDTDAEIDSTQWIDGAALDSVAANRYYHSYFFIVDDVIHWIYPDTEYVTLAQALAGGGPALPPGLAHFPGSVSLVLRGNAAAFPVAGSEQWIDVRPTISSSVRASTSAHANLVITGWPTTGHIGTAATLAGFNGGGVAAEYTEADYLLVDGTRPMTGNLDLDGNTIIFDDDGDAYMWSPIDDVIDVILPGAGGEFAININGAEVLNVTDNALNILEGSNIVMGDDTSIGISGAGRLIFDSSPAPDEIRVVDANLDLNGNKVILDSDGDAYIWSPDDDHIYVVVPNVDGRFGIRISGAEDFNFMPNAFNVQEGSAIYQSEYRYHLGDTDTNDRFRTHRWTLTCGGVTMIDAMEAGTDYLALLNGKNFIGDTANAKMLVGLTINQGGASNEILTLKSSGVAHGMTDITETDSYHFNVKVAASGGWAAVGLTGASLAILIAGNATNEVTTKSTTASGCIELRARKKSGAGVGNMGADANLVVIRNHNTSRFIFDAEGTGHAGVSWVVFSDRRLKRDIMATQYGLAEVLKLQPVDYVLRDQDRAMVGLLAQDVYNIVPEATRKPTTDGSYWSLDYNSIVPVLVRGEQELHEEMAELRQRIEELENGIE